MPSFDADVTSYSMVALLAEGVGRNAVRTVVIVDVQSSPSSRRAWVEIGALLISDTMEDCRPPRGGRG